MASIELKSKYFIPIHWGAFTLSMHPWDEPVKESKRIADERGLNCLTPEIGEILSRKKLNKEFPSWWDQYCYYLIKIIRTFLSRPYKIRMFFWGG